MRDIVRGVDPEDAHDRMQRAARVSQVLGGLIAAGAVDTRLLYVLVDAKGAADDAANAVAHAEAHREQAHHDFYRDPSRWSARSRRLEVELKQLGAAR